MLFISYLVNITCIIARFKPGEYSDQYSPGSEYETVDYTPRGLSKLFIDVTKSRRHTCMKLCKICNKFNQTLHVNTITNATESLRTLSELLEKNYISK